MEELLESPRFVKQILEVPSVCMNELKQTSNLSFNLVYEILKSRRLLIDHVECLENCLSGLEPELINSSIFTLTNTSLITGSVIFMNNFIFTNIKPAKFAITTFASGYGLLTLIKTVSNLRNKIVLKRLRKLISCIEKYGSCIKRMINYFNERQFIKINSHERNVDKLYCERAWQCIKSVRDVTCILFDATKKLEKNYILSTQLSEFYSSMEDLKDCDYFRRDIYDYGPRDIKDFYNIFAYVQSQFLLRLGLSAAEDSSILFLRNDLTIITKSIDEEITNENNKFKRMSFDLKTKQQADISSLHEQIKYQTNFAPSVILKDTSLKLNSYLLSICEEFQRLDEILQNIPDDCDDYTKTVKKYQSPNELVEAANMMRYIELTLANCCDDFHRLMLIYNKFMGNRFNTEFGLIQNDQSSIDNDEFLLAIHSQTKDLNESEDETDDFYAYMFDEQANNIDEHGTNDNNKNTIDYELTNLDKRMTKKRFKPVLEQLKTKIDPIREEMFEKERKILEAKGIDVKKFFDNEKPTENTISDSESDDNDDDDLENISSKKVKNRDNFEDAREFLIQKESLNLFKQLPVCNPIVSEEILE